MTIENADKQALAKLQAGLTLHRQGKLDQARSTYSQVLQLQPLHAHALHLLGVIAAQTNDPKLAVELIGRALAIDPDNATAWFNHGNALIELGQLIEAIDSYDKAIALNPLYFAAHNSVGNALKRAMQPFAAVDSYQRAIAIQPAFADAYINLGLAYVDLNQYRNALTCYDKALTLLPGDVTVLEHQKVALVKFRQHQEEIGNSYSGPYKKPGQALAYCKRGDSLTKQGNHTAAIAHYDEALAIKPDFADAYFGRGNALAALKQEKSAIDSYDKAIAYKPTLASAHLNCATALNTLKQHAEAIKGFNRALWVKELAADAYAGRATAQAGLGQFPEAIESYSLAIDADPDYGHYARGQLLHNKGKICQWQDYHQQVQEGIQRIRQAQKVCLPFAALSFVDSAALHHQVAQIYANDAYPANSGLGTIPRHAPQAKIRLAYFSMDFMNHPVSHLTAELFEIHDRTRFEVIAFAYGPNPQDDMRKRLEKAFDQFIDVNDKTDLEVAQLVRAMKVDIAIDLAGFTGNGRSGIFACRAAPSQVNYLGYPGTMGTSYMDYLIADQQLIPAEFRVHYAEKIAYLPVFQVNDSKRKISDRCFTRLELGLPESGFIFCCFNKSYKITPEVFDSWMRILHRAQGSVLFLLSANDWTQENLKNEALARGINANRLIFGSGLPYGEYLARYRAADLFLDTFPFNAGTTASDALWAGLPVLTCPGETFAGRMASSLMLAIGLPELVAADQTAYEDFAVELATRPDDLAAIHSKLQRHRLTQPLFNTELFARHIENAYSQMVDRYQASLPPDHIFVAQTSAA